MVIGLFGYDHYPAGDPSRIPPQHLFYKIYGFKIFAPPSI